MKRVVIIQKVIPHYRISFFEKLFKFLEEREIKLILIFGSGLGNDKNKKDYENISWGKYAPVIEFKFFNSVLFYQNIFKHLKRGDLIISEQANGNLINYILLSFKGILSFKLALWGHGENFQEKGGNIFNKFKMFWTKMSDAFFAYTEATQKLLKENGYSKDIFCVNNSIDFPVKTLEKIQSKKIRSAPPNNCVFIGGIYSNKRIDFLLDASSIIKKYVPNFTLDVVGDGPEVNKVISFCKKNKWVKFHGRLINEDKLAILAQSKLILMPGLVGLVVIDSFYAQIPIITTEYKGHSPEIEYLKSGINGIITKNDLEDYVENVVDVLNNRSALKSLREGCRESAKIYTIENMVSRFGEGLYKLVNENSSST